MKKRLMLLVALSSLTTLPPVYAQSSDPAIDLINEIAELELNLNEKKAELRELQAMTEGLYTIETNTATLVFSNLRITGEQILIDLDYTNDTKGILDLMNDIWMITFAREDDTSIKQLWLNTEKLPEIEGRETMINNLRLKSGATIKLTIGLTEESMYYYAEDYLGEEIITEEEVAIDEVAQNVPMITDTSLPLYIRVDAYNSPSGKSEEIMVPFAD